MDAAIWNSLTERSAGRYRVAIDHSVSLPRTLYAPLRSAPAAGAAAAGCC